LNSEISEKEILFPKNKYECWQKVQKSIFFFLPAYFVTVCKEKEQKKIELKETFQQHWKSPFFFLPVFLQSEITIKLCNQRKQRKKSTRDV
jgi:hypothetical protein